MSWDRHDINNPELYTPRPNPRVKKAAMQVPMADDDVGLAFEDSYLVMPQEAPTETDDFVYDEDPHWSLSVFEMEVQRAAAAQRTHRAPVQAEAPKAKRVKAPKPSRPERFEKSPARDQNFVPPSQGKLYLFAGVIAACVLILSVIAVMMMPQIAGYFWKDLDNYAFINGELLRYDPKIAATYRQYREYMRKDVIYPGVFVDGTHVGDMTLEEARQALSGATADDANMYSVTVAIGNQTWPINGSNVPAVRSMGNVLERAYAIGRTNTTAILGTQQTPFRERVTTVMNLREAGVNLASEAQFDEAALQAIVDEIAKAVTREPKDAQIKSFDFASRTFGFADEQVGVTIDSPALFQRIGDSLNRREQGVTITVDPVIKQPRVTKAQLAKDFRMIAAYTTDTTNDKNRNNNISLACQAINGTALLPGAVFSFNKATGQRTTDKGYREAGAIAAGQSIEEVGGGICQVSSTLFNAVARANLEIVSRSPHAWPSTYVNRGEDATVNWPNLDFQFKNNQSTPVFIITYYKDRTCSAEVWGMSLGDGVTIDLKSEVVQTISPSSEVRYVNNPNLAFGTSKETIKARTGYVVETYKVWYQNGQEIKREKMHTSTYKAYQRTVEYN